MVNGIGGQQKANVRGSVRARSNGMEPLAVRIIKVEQEGIYENYFFMRILLSIEQLCTSK